MRSELPPAARSPLPPTWGDFGGSWEVSGGESRRCFLPRAAGWLPARLGGVAEERDCSLLAVGHKTQLERAVPLFWGLGDLPQAPSPVPWARAEPSHQLGCAQTGAVQQNLTRGGVRPSAELFFPCLVLCICPHPFAAPHPELLSPSQWSRGQERAAAALPLQPWGLGAFFTLSFSPGFPPHVRVWAPAGVVDLGETNKSVPGPAVSGACFR